MPLIDVGWERSKILINYKNYIPCIVRAARKILGDSVRIYLSGSVVEGKAVPSSDVDVIIVVDFEIKAKDRASIVAKIEEICNLPFVNPFEFHILSKQEFDVWVKIFSPKLLAIFPNHKK